MGVPIKNIGEICFLSKLKNGGLGDPNWPVLGEILDW